MKPIQPITIWVNGQTKTGSWLGARSINDNLIDTAVFYYWISDDNNGEAGQQLANGNLTMTGQDYQDWNANPDINQAAYAWIAAQLGLTLI